MPEEIKVKFGIKEPIKFGLGFGIGLFIWGILLAIIIGLILSVALNNVLEKKGLSKSPSFVDTGNKALNEQEQNNLSDMKRESEGQYDAFAQCLRTKGVKMYGAYWCGHCQNQKEKFGSSFKYIEYIECSQEGNPRAVNPICVEQNISGYPTWKFANGTKLIGEQTFEKLSEVSGCSIK